MLSPNVGQTKEMYMLKFVVVAEKSEQAAIRLFNKPSADRCARYDAICGYFMCSMINPSSGAIYSLDERINRRGDPTYPWAPSAPYSVREYNRYKKYLR